MRPPRFNHADMASLGLAALGLGLSTLLYPRLPGLVSGQVIPRLRRNPFAGFRNPWALRSDEVWQRTQRFGGYSLTLGGLATLALAPFSTPAALGALVVSGLAPALYSFLLSTSPVRER
ncbi:MAG TPA: SdpI family protein [Archangium sp.]|uniref:SdpI family protein n=1 Tax=Archangium sp. TaxID=1872627 RepID=UPI002E341E82|nr:SdpI family protein [Archangium sp.]HEX5752723.1 SdpI family protein [Archangium sp.]